MPRLVVLKLLLLVAEKRGPESVTLLGAAAEVERRRLRMAPEVSTLVLLNERSAEEPVLVSVALSPTKTNDCASVVVGSPFLRMVLVALKRGPDRVMDGGSPRLDARTRKFPKPLAVSEPPLIEISGFVVVVVVRVAPLKMPNASFVVVIVALVALSSGPFRLRLAGVALDADIWSRRPDVGEEMAGTGLVPPRVNVVPET